MDDRPNRPGTRRALVPQTKGRALDDPSRVQVQLGRLSASRRSIRLGGRVAAVAAILCLTTVVLLYARLLAGPVSFSFLVPTLQNQLNSQLQGYSFHASDAFLRLSSGWRLEFRLADVRLLDESNQEIAKAPFASIGISERSLLKFSLAASRISLLGPKLLVFNSPGKGLTLTAPPVSSEAPEPAGPSAWESGEPLGEAPYADLAAKERMRDAAGSVQNAQPMAERFNPAPLLSRLFTALKARGGASSALERIGVKKRVAAHRQYPQARAAGRRAAGGVGALRAVRLSSGARRIAQRRGGHPADRPRARDAAHPDGDARERP